MPRTALAALALVLGARAASAAPVDDKAFVAAHAEARKKHCAAPLRWSRKLAASAQRWADGLGKKGCALQHSGGPYGENLAAGTQGTLDAATVVGMWYRELKDYAFGKGRFSMKTGHFTQVVWQGTTELGCGVARCEGVEVFVCQYDPPGNVEGEFGKNVQPLGCR